MVETIVPRSGFESRGGRARPNRTDPNRSVGKLDGKKLPRRARRWGRAYFVVALKRLAPVFEIGPNRPNAFSGPRRNLSMTHAVSVYNGAIHDCTCVRNP